jgi:hypothetical protein
MARKRFFERFRDGTPSKFRSSIQDMQPYLWKRLRDQGQIKISTRLDPLDKEKVFSIDYTYLTGWVLKERIGWTVQDLHKPVPE